MNITIHKAKWNEKAIIRNMMSLYVHDLSEYINLDLDASGAFDYPYLDHYWKESDRFPFIILNNKLICGFALIRQNPKNGIDYEMAEFFVLRRHRRHGIGEIVAKRMFRKFRGRWKVQCLRRNKTGLYSGRQS